MSRPVYEHGFYAIFVGELEKCRWPVYPTPSWWRCLRQADHEATIESIRRQVMIEYRLTGIQHRHGRQQPEMLPIAGRSRAARQLDTACSRFLESRGIPAGDFHAY
jgi:hypothetical protein